MNLRRTGICFVLACAAVSDAAAQSLFPIQDPAAIDPMPPGVEAPPADILTMTFADYPVESVLAMEEGSTVLALTVAEDGHVAGADIAASSGYARLDDAARRIAQERWQFVPPKRGGTPVWTAARVTVNWRLPLQDARPFLRGLNAMPGNVPPEPLPVGEDGEAVCSPRPDISAAQRLLDATPEEILRWTEIDEQGDVANILLLTEKGWMRLAQSTVQAIDTNYYVVPKVHGRPVRCWYESGADEVFAQADAQ